MNAIQTIRKQLGMTQVGLADSLGVSQGSISFYENGQIMSPAVAGKLIELAASHGLAITFEHVYGAAEIPDDWPEAADVASVS